MGGKLPNAFGLYDMLGNIWEWTSSGYKSTHVLGEDPFVEADATGIRVIRGGSWLTGAGDCRAACRFRGVPSDRDDNLGCRLVRVLPS